MTTIEHIMANVFYLTFLNVFYFSWNVFYIYGLQWPARYGATAHSRKL